MPFLEKDFIPFKELKKCLLADLKYESLPFCSTFQAPAQEE